MNRIVIINIWLLGVISFAQPNCFIYPEGSGEREACELSYKAIEYPQGSRASQELFDEAIAIGPKYAWAYYEKSVPYFKRGFLNKGLQILNKAIELEPREYLCYRAYWYWQYKNYALCIADLESYYKLPKAYLQQTPGGDKDMRLILGLAYAKQGELQKAIFLFNKAINFNSDLAAAYVSLGVIFYKQGKEKESRKFLLTAASLFKKQGLLKEAENIQQFYQNQ